jgi:hypothetical protein
VNQHKQSSDLHIGRGWLNRAAEMLDACEDHVSDAEFATAAAAVGNGFVQLAAVEQWAAGRAEDVERQAERRAQDAPLNASIVEAHQLAAELAQQQLKTLRANEIVVDAAAFQREAQARAEARPHDDEPVNLRETDADMAARFAGQVGELTSRIDDALSWLDEPDDATPEIQLAKIRAALTGEADRG